MRFSSVVANNQLLVDLIAYLARRFTYHTTQEWVEHVAQGRVLVNDSPATQRALVHPGDTITYLPLPFDEPPADLNYRIVYQDAWVMAIDKPGNLLVHRAGKSFTNNLVYRLRSGFGGHEGWPQAGSINRLDRETSGIVLIGRNESVVAAFQKEFRENLVHKEYLAIVPRTQDALPDRIDLAIGPDRDGPISYCHKVDPLNGKSATTLIERCLPCGSGHWVVCVRPLTGRTHQIRVHLHALGCPIVGDKLYGLSPQEYLAWRENPAVESAKLAFPRQALHCSRLVCKHPFRGGQLDVRAPVPADLCGLIDQLGSS